MKPITITLLTTALLGPLATAAPATTLLHNRSPPPPWGPTIEHRLHQQFDSGPRLSPEYCFGQLLIRPAHSGATRASASCVSTRARFAETTPCGNFKVGLYRGRLVVVNLSFAYNQPASLCTLGLDAQLTCGAGAGALDSKMEWVGGKLRARAAGKKAFALEDITRGGYLEKEVRAAKGGGWEIFCAHRVAHEYFPYQTQQ